MFLPTAALLFLSMGAAWACPLCMGWGQPSKVQQLVAAPDAVLAVPTADAGRFRVVHVLKGERPPDGTLEGGYPRNAPASDGTPPTEARPLLIVRDDPFPTWIVLGAIDAARADWLRAVAAGKPAAERSPEEWSARVALVVPQLNDPDPLAAQLASAELAAAPYDALRTAKSLLDVAALRRCLADPRLAARHPMCLLLLGIAGNAQDATTLEERLQAAWESGDATNLSSMLSADLELRGAARVAWIESNYLADPKRSSPEVRAALLALSVHGNANAAIPRERVIAAYRVFMKAHPETAGDVAPDLAAWQYWDAVPEYLALMRSKVRQQYPSRLAVQAYLLKGLDAQASGSSPAAALAERRTLQPGTPSSP